MDEEVLTYGILIYQLKKIHNIILISFNHWLIKNLFLPLTVYNQKSLIHHKLNTGCLISF